MTCICGAALAIHRYHCRICPHRLYGLREAIAPPQVRICTAQEIIEMIFHSLHLLTARNLPLMSSLLFLILINACQTPGTSEKEGADPYDYMVIEEIHIPILTTPEEQLAYARSTFDTIEEKTAALKAVSAIHPTARLDSGMAALELAYLQLGDDYRLANDRQCSLAEDQFLAILDEFIDLPEIAAKALWYLGWIACDLQQAPDKGIGYYLRIVNQYPREKLTLLPAAPWLTVHLLGEKKKPQPYYPKSLLSWADMAHLEIIRHTSDREQAGRSISAIQKNNSSTLFEGTALKVLVARHSFTPESEQLVTEYLAKPVADNDLKNDLILALSAHRRGL